MVMGRAILFGCVAVVAVSSPVLAQRWGQGGFPREGVCFFKDPNFHGDYFCARSGENSGSVPDGMNDKVSSIRVFGGAEVVVFKDIRFAGRSSRFGGDVPNLKHEGWSDLISSFQVRRGSVGAYGWGGRPPSGRPTEDPESDRTSRLPGRPQPGARFAGHADVPQPHHRR